MGSEMCIRDRNGLECPSTAIEDIYGQCRQPVADVTVCPKGTLGVPGGCYIVVDKVMPKVLTSG